MLERLKDQEKEKKKRATGKKGRSTAQKGAKKTRESEKDRIVKDENHCQLCGAQFHDGDEETCLGCDECWRWVHCYCAGFEITPDTDEEWLCQQCQ